ncbi:hypothetical protein RHMOL_Rhmol11G0059800 [Rhododendron molle]|uniref:Uncharacterized protein n=1 Tax=Rhododendron molle TaxID=49168 RepID=A0ACC0LP13_RHOML|nr:hypothetical protein RHMOL_Rhmol11G0059800 [Rhododendron molle]
MDITGNELDYVSEETEVFTIVTHLIRQKKVVCGLAIIVVQVALERYYSRHESRFTEPNPFQEQIDNINRLVRRSDVTCLEQLRMDRNCFMRLCNLIETVGGLSHSRSVCLEEKVAMFLYTIAHYHKNRVVKHHFFRSGQTVSRHFNDVLRAVIRLQGQLLVKPEPITQACTDDRWKIFQNCLGPLDGTYIDVRVGPSVRPRYRNQKGELAINVLGVCNTVMNIIYVLSGWEGLAADSRILRDAITRTNGLKIPTGSYYLVDAGYTNAEGFLAPYRGKRYHLKEWDGPAPQDHEEYFNMKHAQARNVIERTFGLLKIRWAILRSYSFFPIRTQSRIVTACCLVHNHIRKEMSIDPHEHELDNLEEEDHDDDYIDTVETSGQWTDWRDAFAQHIYQEWQERRGHGGN